MYPPPTYLIFSIHFDKKISTINFINILLRCHKGVSSKGRSEKCVLSRAVFGDVLFIAVVKSVIPRVLVRSVLFRPVVRNIDFPRAVVRNILLPRAVVRNILLQRAVVKCIYLQSRN